MTKKEQFLLTKYNIYVITHFLLLGLIIWTEMTSVGYDTVIVLLPKQRRTKKAPAVFITIA